MNNEDTKKDLETVFKEDEARDKVIEEVHSLINEWPKLPLPEQTKKLRSILFQSAILREEDRELCVRHLGKAGIIKPKQALAKIKNHARNIGIDKEETPPDINYAPQLTLITPAQDFIDNVAYVTVPVKLVVNNKVEIVNYLINSEREKLRLSDDELLRMKKAFYSERIPYLISRWSDSDIGSFLNNEGAASIADVYSDIYQLCKEHIDFGNDTVTKYISLWIIGTYFHRIFETYPYVHLNGDMESGKTKTLMFTAWLSFNGELTFNSSPSYVVRAVHNNHSTCCIDEVERLKRSDDQDSQLLIAMYNSGYKKGSFCGKSEQNDKDGRWIPKQFEAYAPKMLASIKGFESSLSSRCVPVIMLNTGNKEVKNRELRSYDQRFQLIRNKLYRVMLTYHIPIQAIYKIIKDEEILGREWELAKPILTLAKDIDTDNDSQFNLYSEIRTYLLETQKLKKAARIEETVTPKVLKVLKDVLSTTICPNPDNFWSIQDLICFLKDSGEEDFAWLNDETKHHRGRWLGDALRTAGIVNGRAEQSRNGIRNVKGFRISLEKVEEKLKNYEI